MRVRKKPWAQDELNTNIHVVAGPENQKGSWSKYFGNTNPIYIEIGCGKGRFLSQTAAFHPDINFIGIEKQPTVVAVAARRLSPEAKNVALICGDVEKLEEYFDQGEIKRIYINFCDPWPRKKWAKRRLTHTGFLNTYKKLFYETGEIFFKTDNRNLFEFSLNEFCANGWNLSHISLDLHNSDFEGNIMTEYEEKFSSQGMPIYRLEARLANK